MVSNPLPDQAALHFRLVQLGYSMHKQPDGSYLVVRPGFLRRAFDIESLVELVEQLESELAQ